MQEKILIVDGNDFERGILYNILQEDYKIFETASASIALEYLKVDKQNIALVLVSEEFVLCNEYNEIIKLNEENRCFKIVYLVENRLNLKAEISKQKTKEIIEKPYITEKVRKSVNAYINRNCLVENSEIDKATGVYTQDAFFEVAKKMISLQEPGFYVMACFEIDNLNKISEQFNSAKGAEVLRCVENMFNLEFSRVGGIVCHTVTGKFGLLYPKSFMSSDEIVQLRNKVIYIDGSMLPLTYSIGRYIIDDLSLAVAEIYERSLIALVYAKECMDTNIALYDENIHTYIAYKQEVFIEMNNALKTNQFEVWFQPQYNNSSGLLIGAEALVRWNHPQRGIICPKQFIDIFEQNGFVYELDKYVWEQTCIMLRDLMEAGEYPLPVSVNVSRYDIFREDLLDVLISITSKYSIPTKMLHLEIIDFAFSKLTDKLIKVINQIVSYGFIIEIDGFGSGYSSFNSIRKLPINIIKLDMSSMIGDNDSRGGNILESIVRMAKWLDIQVVAKSVETKEQDEFLKSIGCNYVQGFLYCNPIKEEEYIKHELNSQKQLQRITLETIETHDNNEFWNPRSMETLIFNSYVEGACIFEYYNGNVELLRVNEKYIKELGEAFSAEETIALKLEEHLDEENFKKMNDNILKAIETNDESTSEIKMCGWSIKGKEIFLRVTVRQIAKAGERRLFYSSIINVTELRQMQIRESIIAEQLKAIMENINGGVTAVVLEEDKPKFIFVNDKYFSLLGYTRDEFFSENVSPYDVIYEEDRDEIIEKTRVASYQQENFTCRFRVVKKDGTIAWMLNNISVTFLQGYDVPVQLGVLNDITTQIEAQQRVVEISERIQAIMDNVKSGITAVYYCGETTNVIFANDVYYRLLGYTKLQFENEVKDRNAYIHEQDRTWVTKKIEMLNSVGKTISMEYRVIKRDGEAIWVKHILTLTNFIEISEPVYLSIFMDITDEKVIRQKMIEVSAQMQEIMKNVNGGVSATTLCGDKIEYIYVNEHYYSLFGYTKEQFKKECPCGIADLICTEDSSYVTEKMHSNDRNLKQTIIEFRTHKRDGSIIWVRSQSSVCYIEGIKDSVHISVMNDITKEKEAEQKIVETTEQLKFLNESAHILLENTESNAGIINVLNNMMDYFDGERAYVAEFDNRKNTLISNYEVCSKGIDLQKEKYQKVTFDETEFWYKLFEENKYVNIKSIDLLDEDLSEQKEFLISKNLKAIIAVPFQQNGKLVGFIGIDNPQKNMHHIDRLIALGDYISIMLLRRDLTQKIKNDNEMLTNLLNDMPGGFARFKVLPEKGMSLEYINKGFCNLVNMRSLEIFELFGKNAFDGVHEEDRGALDAEIRKATPNYNYFKRACRIRHKDKGFIWTEAVGRMYKDQLEDRYLNIYFYDITERRKEEAYRNKLFKNLPSGAGIYNYYPKNKIEQVYVNNGYYRLIGADRENRKEYKDFSAILSVHPEDRKSLFTELEYSIAENRSANITVRILCGNGTYKWINIMSNVAVKENDKYVLYVSFTDVNQLKTTQLELRASQRAMQVASSSSGIAFWLFNIDRKEILQNFQEEMSLGYKKHIENVPESLCGTGEIPVEDEPYFIEMYQKLFDGEESSECTVRIFNYYTQKYEWRHIVYTRLHDTEYASNIAVGFSANVDLEQENRQRYERELRLRKKMIENSIAYYQVNLTTGVMEEYHSRFSDIPEVKLNSKITKELDEALLSNVVPEDRDKVKNTIFLKALNEAYKKGETSISLIYRRNMKGIGLRYVEAIATIVEQPNSGDVVAFVHNNDIDSARKDQLALESIMDEEIETVGILNIKTGLAHFVQIRVDFGGIQAHSEFAYDKKFEEIIHKQVIEEDQKICEEFFYSERMQKALESEKVIKLIYRIQDDKSGKVLRKKTRAFYLDNTKEEVIFIRRDITDLYEEQEIQRQKLQKAVEEANKANQAKSEFLSRMSHDMRTPLNAVLAFSSNEMIEDLKEPQLKNNLEKIHSSGDLLLGIINDVLDMSKIEQKKMNLNLRPYSLIEFKKTISIVMSELCKKKGIDFVPIFNGKMYDGFMVDKVRFNQIFVNLLSNAVKFTPTGGRIEFIIENSKEINKNFVNSKFIVRDNGIGMSSEFIPHAFESFSQEYHSGISESNQGTGLGLSIVKEIVNLMSGTIALESEVGKGTTFTVILPIEIAQEEQIDKKQVQKEAISLNGMRILICEDNLINSEIAMKLLEKQGCIVELAKNGKEGLEKFEASEKNYYECILMDIRMPVMGGLEASQRIRLLDRVDAQTIPIVAMTADAFTEDERETCKAGMNEHLTKPIEPRRLFDVLRNLKKS